jgi:tetratricopeptide (TPR) repeat protein
MLGKHQEAINCYENISLEDPTVTAEKKAFVWNNKGIAYLHLREYEDAISCFVRVLHIDPEYTDAKLNMQKALGKLSAEEHSGLQ